MPSISAATRGRRAFDAGRANDLKPGSRHLSVSSQLKMRTRLAPVPSSSEVTSVDDASPAIGTNLPGSSSLGGRSEEHTSELQSLMRISYAVFCLKKKKKQKHEHISH